jgi:hypothetical protein
MSSESDDEPDDVSPHVHLKISPAKKRRWVEYADEHYRGNLSSLIEDAVDNTLSGMWVLKSESAEQEAEQKVNVDLSGLDEGLDHITTQLSAIQDQLDTVASGSSVEPGRRLEREELVKLASKVHDSLPLVSGTHDLVDLKNAVVTLPTDERAKLSGTIDDLAAHLDRDPIEVWQACLFLENDEHNNVYSIVDEGDRRWYELKPQRAEE